MPTDGVTTFLEAALADIDPRIVGAPPIPAVGTREHAHARPGRSDVDQESRSPTPGHGDRAELSAAARAHLAQHGAGAHALSTDPLALANTTAQMASGNTDLAGAAHTAAVARAARLIR